MMCLWYTISMKTTSRPYRKHPAGPRRLTQRQRRRLAADRAHRGWPPVLPILPRRPLRGCLNVWGQTKPFPEAIFGNPFMRQAYRDWLSANCERMIADGKVSAVLVRKCFRLTEHSQLPNRCRFR